MRIAITGVTGFIGGALVDALEQRAIGPVTGLVRSMPADADSRRRYVAAGDLGTPAYGSLALAGAEVVVHAAARVHVMRDHSADPLSAFRRTNVDGTLSLARHAVESGVRRFVFISSLKVNGEASQRGRPIRASDAPAPVDPYGRSKAEAEEGLREIALRHGMELVIIRPPLVYGPGVRGNFAALAKAMRAGFPLPLAAVTGNRRSLVALDNLTDLLVQAATVPAAAGQTFLVSDDEDLSTAELLRRMASALRRPARLVAVPPRLLRSLANLAGMPGAAQRLLDTLQVDITETRNRLNWHPPLSVDMGLARALRARDRSGMD